MNRFSKSLGATAAYWAVILLGPALIVLLNNIGYVFTGGGYSQDSFMYKVLVFLAQPISCYVASEVAKTIYEGNVGKCVFINCIIGTVFCGVLLLLSDGGLEAKANMIVSLIVCVITAVTSHTKK